jgi:hypothetical protein
MKFMKQVLLVVAISVFAFSACVKVDIRDDDGDNGKRHLYAERIRVRK